MFSHAPGDTKTFNVVREPPVNGTVPFYIETSTVNAGYFIGVGPGLTSGVTLTNGQGVLSVKLAAYAPTAGIYRIRMMGKTEQGDSQNNYSEYVSVGDGYISASLLPAGIQSVPYNTNGTAKLGVILHNAVTGTTYNIRMSYTINGYAVPVDMKTVLASRPTEQVIFDLSNLDGDPLSQTLRVQSPVTVVITVDNYTMNAVASVRFDSPPPPTPTPTPAPQWLRKVTVPKIIDPLNDSFGWSVSLNSGKVYASNPYEVRTGTNKRGTIYVLDANSGISEKALSQLTNVTGGVIYDNFGWNVAHTGALFFAGIPTDVSTGVSTSIVNAYSTSTLLLAKTYTNPVRGVLPAYNFYGWAVAAHGNNIAVGSPYQSSDGVTIRGRVYVQNIDTAELVHDITVDSAPRNANFGHSVDLSNDYIAVGIPTNDNGVTPGRVDIFSAVTGQFIRSIYSPTLLSAPAFGWSVSINGNLLAVGSPFEPIGSNGGLTGVVYIFDITTGAANRILYNPGIDTTVDGDNFGWSVAFDGAYLAVGAPTENVQNSATAPSKTYIYNFNFAPITTPIPTLGP